MLAWGDITACATTHLAFLTSKSQALKLGLKKAAGCQKPARFTHQAPLLLLSFLIGTTVRSAWHAVAFITPSFQ